MPDAEAQVAKEIEQVVLQQEGLADWSIKDAEDGYCWYDQKVIQRIPGDFALFLHECAHAKCAATRTDPLWNRDPTGHHALWADCYTDLVRRHFAAFAAQQVAQVTAELEQERVRLAGVLTQLEGHDDPDVVQGVYGWSLPYERARELRQQVREAEARVWAKAARMLKDTIVLNDADCNPRSLLDEFRRRRRAQEGTP